MCNFVDKTLASCKMSVRICLPRFAVVDEFPNHSEENLVKSFDLMLKTTLALLLVCALGGIAMAERPNVLLIVADDMGFSDLGSFGSEISTPHLDAMAQQGVRLTNLHASPSCSPTRAMLMSGCDNHTAGLGAMLEQVKDSQKDQPGYEAVLSDRVASLPAICLLYTSPSPRDLSTSRMPSSA